MKPHVAFDPVFGMHIGTFDGSVRFVQRFKITDRAEFVLEGDVRAQACNEQTCTPPLPVDFAFTSGDLPETVASSADNKTPVAIPQPPLTEDTLPATDSAGVATLVAPITTGHAEIDKNPLWTPVIEELKAYGMEGNVSEMSLWWIFISGFIGGIIALLTPCVWPMIPMTVSFFLKRNAASRKNRLAGHCLWCGHHCDLSGLGLLITAIFGASALNNLATSAVFNLIFLPCWCYLPFRFWRLRPGAARFVDQQMDSKAESASGTLSIFFMAFTLVLVSFSCTGPIIGTLLVEAATWGNILSPTIGMFGFALALAIPFALFAIFPSWLQTMPKSGGWLNAVKIVLGFLELAFALKFLSVADLAYGWGILDREVFLVLWIVIFALLGMYLLGKLKFPHDSEVEHVSIPRLFLAIFSFAFAIYLVPGLWGAPLKAISAFSPPMYTQDFSLYDGEVRPKYTDYESGMAYAKQVGKPALLDFAGYGCVNCRKMEASVWTDPRVKNIIDNEYVLITLVVDDKTRLPEVIEVEENGRITRLKTVGDKWSYLQRHKLEPMRSRIT